MNEKFFYVVYKITNLLNNKYYVGVHKTLDFSKSSYYGSGIAIKKAIEKYGVENFKREVLYLYHSPEVAYKRESYIVDEAFVKNPETYNMKLGGKGGWEACHTEEARQKRVESFIENGSSLLTVENLLSEEVVAKKLEAYRIRNLEKFPILEKEYDLLNGESRVVKSDNLYNIASLIYGSKRVSTKHLNLFDSNLKPKEILHGSWKGYKLSERSTTSV